MYLQPQQWKVHRVTQLPEGNSAKSCCGQSSVQSLPMTRGLSPNKVLAVRGLLHVQCLGPEHRTAGLPLLQLEEVYDAATCRRPHS